MSTLQSFASQIDFSHADFQWACPESESLSLPHISGARHAKFFRIDAIVEDAPATLRLAMGNVIACMNDDQSGVSMVYMISSTQAGVHFYLGVAGPDRDAVEEGGALLHDSFSGNFLGATLTSVAEQNLEEAVIGMRRQGYVLGVPSSNETSGQQADDKADFQGVERLINSLAGKRWSLTIVATPGSTEEIRGMIDRVYALSTTLSAQVKCSVQLGENDSKQESKTQGSSNSDTTGDSRSDTKGESDSRSKSSSTSTNNGKSGSSWSESTGTSDGKDESHSTNSSVTTGQSTSRTEGRSDSLSQSETQGSSIALTRERINKCGEELLEHLAKTQLPRLRQGYGKGMFRTAIYLCAETLSVHQWLGQSVLSIFQGRASTMTPLRVHWLRNAPLRTLGDRLRLYDGVVRSQCARDEAVHSLAMAHGDTPIGQNATWLHTEELALLMGMPGKELPGIKVRKSVDFALNVPESQRPGDAIELGKVVQHGRQLSFKPVHLLRSELDKHVFVTGVTGSGKTTTCLKILLESDLPFLVIEPAKTEYRALYAMRPDVRYYTLGREDLTPFRLNPFELLPGEQLASHIDTLKATLTAVYPMEAAMPYIVAEAIIKAYQARGWVVHSGDNLLHDDPFAADLHGEAWPTCADMIRELDAVIKAKGMGHEFEEKYRGSLVARLTDLTLGTKGRMLNTRQSLDFDQLLDQCVVIELEEIKDESDKALFMGLILTRVAESIKHRHRRDPGFRHLTLLEEAHRLLSKPDPGEQGSKKLGVDMFCNLLAEVRKYGEGLIIADQIPNKLVSDVIKNTNLKIVHRLFAADDRNVIGDTMCLSDEQKDYLPALQAGQAVIYGGGWHAPVHAQILRNADTTAQPLDEALIRQHGRAQLWAQRHVLYPQLAALDILVDGDQLAGFQREASKLVGMLLRVMVALSVRQSGQPKNMLPPEQLYPRLCDRVQHSLPAWRAHLDDTSLLALLRACIYDETDIPLSANHDAALNEWLTAVVLEPVADVSALRADVLEDARKDVESWVQCGWLVI